MSSEYIHTISLTRHFARSLRNLSKEDQERILSKIDELGRGIVEGKMLRGNYREMKSLRIGKYRIIYREPKWCTLELLDVGNRETIYSKL